MGTKPSRWVVAALASVVVAQLVGAAAVVVVRTGANDRPPTVEELLAGAQEHLRQATSFAFRGHARWEAPLDDGRPGRGQSLVSRYRVEGAYAGLDRVQYGYDGGTGDSGEGVRIGRLLWIRLDDAEQSEVPSGPWYEFDLEQAPGAAGSTLGDGINVIQYVLAAGPPELVASTGVRTILRAPVDLARANLAVGTDADGTAAVRIELSADGRPAHLTIDHTGLDGGAVDIGLEVELFAWDEPVVIEAPPEGDIDRTPFVEEEQLAAFDDVPVFQPAGIPEGWVLAYAGVLPAEETPEGCDQVELDYTDPDDLEYGYLTLYQLPTTCAFGDVPEESVPFQAGPHRGWVVADEYEGYAYTYAEIVVGQTLVQADTDLSATDLAAVLAELRPLDTTVEPRPLPGLGGRTVTS